MFKEKFKGKTCIVTGGAGFIGSSLVEELISNGANVKIIDNLIVGMQNVDFLKKIGAVLFKNDICNYDEINVLFKNVDYVFHLAAMNRAQRSINDPIKSNDINVNGTLNCLHLSHLHKVKKFIFVSSSSVYKGVENEALKEGMFLEPLHPYGIGKLTGEHYCRIYNDLFNLDTIVLRYFSVYGPRQRGDIEHAGVIAKFFLQAKENKDITIYGDGKQRRNFSMVLDVVKGTLLGAVKKEAIGKIINIASEKEYTVKEIAENIIKITNSKSKIVFLDPLKGDPMRNKADVSKANNILEFQADYTLQKGLEYINKKLF
ncbi:MAG: NAD-dependent epimerase/dehydratase family protein [Candidatus Poseidoniales archaeon]